MDGDDRRRQKGVHFGPSSSDTRPSSSDPRIPTDASSPPASPATHPPHNVQPTQTEDTQGDWEEDIWSDDTFSDIPDAPTSSDDDDTGDESEENESGSGKQKEEDEEEGYGYSCDSGEKRDESDGAERAQPIRVPRIILSQVGPPACAWGSPDSLSSRSDGSTMSQEYFDAEGSTQEEMERHDHSRSGFSTDRSDDTTGTRDEEFFDCLSARSHKPSIEPSIEPSSSHGPSVVGDGGGKELTEEKEYDGSGGSEPLDAHKETIESAKDEMDFPHSLECDSREERKMLSLKSLPFGQNLHSHHHHLHTVTLHHLCDDGTRMPFHIAVAEKEPFFPNIVKLLFCIAIASIPAVFVTVAFLVCSIFYFPRHAFRSIRSGGHSVSCFIRFTRFLLALLVYPLNIVIDTLLGLFHALIVCTMTAYQTTKKGDFIGVTGIPAAFGVVWDILRERFCMFDDISVLVEDEPFHSRAWLIWLFPWMLCNAPDDDRLSWWEARNSRKEQGWNVLPSLCCGYSFCGNVRMAVEFKLRDALHADESPLQVMRETYTIQDCLCCGIPRLVDPEHELNRFLDV
jgi:hypothetical protein